MSTPMLEKLKVWYQMSEQLRQLRDQEMALRKEIFGACFADPKEGTNKLDLGDGHELVATYKLDRKLDEAAFQSLRQPFYDKFGTSADRYIRTKVELDTKNYKTLTFEERQFFDNCIVVKPGSPSLAIRPVSKKGKKS